MRISDWSSDVCSSDLISIAVEEAKFGFTEVRIGVAPAVISVMCLSKLRTADARATFLRGHRFSAVEAAEMGLINAAVPADRLDSEVDAIVDALLAAAPGGLAAAQELLARVPPLRPAEALEGTSTMSGQPFTTT